jgi:hypothetical protein
MALESTRAKQSGRSSNGVYSRPRQDVNDIMNKGDEKSLA